MLDGVVAMALLFVILTSLILTSSDAEPPRAATRGFVSIMDCILICFKGSIPPSRAPSFKTVSGGKFGVSTGAGPDC